VREEECELSGRFFSLGLWKPAGKRVTHGDGGAGGVTSTSQNSELMSSSEPAALGLGWAAPGLGPGRVVCWRLFFGNGAKGSPPLSLLGPPCLFMAGTSPSPPSPPAVDTKA